MRVLKAVVCLALTTLITVFSAAAGTKAFADGAAGSAPQTAKSYAYVDLGKEVYFYSEKKTDCALFIIPQTYCVEILGKDGDWYYVKYAEDTGVYRAVYGYCRLDEVVPVDEPLENLYLNMTVPVVYRSNQSVGFLPALGDLEFTAAYYGAYSVGKTSCSYVLCGECFGYIAGSVQDYPLNELPSKSASGTEKKDSSGATLITAIAITVVAAGAILILYFTGKKPPKETSEES